MNILVIGNGFDLAHNLKTTYNDYLDYVTDFKFFYKEMIIKHNHKPDINVCVNNDNIQYFINLFNNFESNIYNREIIEEQNKLIYDNLWISYFHKNKTKLDKRWVDFEKEISQVIQLLDEFRHKVIYDSKKIYQYRVPLEEYFRNVLKDFMDNEEGLSLKDIDDLKNHMLVDLNRLTRSYELYITSFIEKQDIKKRLSIIEKLSIDKVLSFNYSDTYEKWYGVNKDNIEYDYIHGKAGIGKDVDTCNMVLGIDEYLDENERIKDNNFIEFKKFYQRIYKQTGSKYLSWLGNFNYIIGKTSKSNLTKTNIYIYGHSLDITDGDIIAKLIRQECATTIIYYHSKKTLGKQIANLVKILGEDELIDRTSDFKPSILFKPCFN